MLLTIDCRYIRGQPSGIGTYLQALVERVPALATSRQFVFWTGRRTPRPLSIAANVSHRTVLPGPNSPLTLFWPRAFASFEGVDLIHCPHNTLPYGVPCASVVTVHDVLAIDHPHLHRPGWQRIKGLYYPQAVRRALRQATRLIVPTAATADRIMASVPAAAPRVRVIPMAPDTAFRPAADVSRLDRTIPALAGVDAPYVLVLGHNSVNKHHALALAAFAAGAPPTWRLVAVQRLGRPAALQRLADRLGIANRVVWLKTVPQAELVALLQHAAALVQPSRYEGFGLPVVEAMACGCPVIASDIPALREVCGGAALLVPPDDGDRLAAAIRQVAASHDLREQLSGSGLRRAAAFSWDRTARETLEVYEEALRADRSVAI